MHKSFYLVKMKFLWLYLLALLVVQYEAAKILVLTPVGSKSHKNFFMSVVKVMAAKGHQVTIVSAQKNSKDIKNVRDVVLPTRSADTFVRDVFGNKNKPIFDLISNSPYVCTEGLLTEEIKSLKKEKFDLILVSLFFSECYISLVHHFKAPFGWMLPGGLFGPLITNSGNINFPSFVPNKILTARYPLSFVDRLQSLFLDSMFKGSYELFTLPKMEQICHEKGACPPDMPPISDFFPNASLTILNRIETLEVPQRPYMSNTIFAGGLHCVPSKPLPKDLETWFQESGNAGVIYFSLGSAVTPSDMPDEYRETLIKVFGSLKQRVLWKWNEESMPGLPPNVKISKWLPQQDILGHPKTRMFITHGGLLSTMEATYHGCPILGMPLYGDQPENVKEGVTTGWAHSLMWEDLTKENLHRKIQDVLNDKSLRDNIKLRASFMKDVDMTPQDRISFWIDYVLRYDGAPHLRSPIAAMPLYKLYNMDVWATMLVILVVFVYGIWAFLKYLFKRVCSKIFSSKTQNKQKKKKA